MLDRSKYISVLAVVLLALVSLAAPAIAATNGTVNVTGTPDPVVKLVFTTPARTITAGSPSAVMTIQPQDAWDNPVNLDADTTINLTSTSAQGKFSPSASPWSDITWVTILSGSNSASFYYKDTTVGNPTITASESPDKGWTDAEQQQTVTTSGGGGALPSYGMYLNIDFMGNKTAVKMSKDGILQEAVELVSPDEDWALKIGRDTKILTADGTAATEIVAGETTELPPPSGGTIVKAINLGPAGITFSPPATLKIILPSAEVPENISSVIVAYYMPETGWTEVYTEWRRSGDLVIATAQIRHFTPFAAIYYLLAPPVFSISDLTISHSQVDPGQEIVIVAIVTNSGSTAGDYTVELKINNLTEATKQLSVDAGASVVVNFAVNKDEGGSYQVDVNGLTGEFTIIEVSPLAQPPQPWVALPWYIWVIIGIVFVAIGTLSWLIMRRRRREETEYEERKEKE